MSLDDLLWSYQMSFFCRCFLLHVLVECNLRKIPDRLGSAVFGLVALKLFLLFVVPLGVEQESCGVFNDSTLCLSLQFSSSFRRMSGETTGFSEMTRILVFAASLVI